MEKKIHCFGDKPKLIEIINYLPTQDECDVLSRHILFDTNMKKLFEYDSYNFKSLNEHLEKKIICFDDYFVIDSKIQYTRNPKSKDFYRVYDYDALLICQSSKYGWGPQGELDVHMSKKYYNNQNCK